MPSFGGRLLHHNATKGDKTRKRNALSAHLFRTVADTVRRKDLAFPFGKNRHPGTLSVDGCLTPLLRRLHCSVVAAFQVLIVDDDPWILKMVTTVLGKRGTRSTPPSTAGGLLKACEVKPDLIVTDIMMPKMDGWTLVRSLRQRSDLALTPVIFLSALGSDEDRIQGFRLGADDYLPKPFRFEELDLRVSNALRKRKAMTDSLRTQGPRR